MKATRSLQLLALATLFATQVAAAGNWETSGYTGIGYVDEAGVDDNSFSGSSSLVYRFNETLGVEGGYTRFGDFKDSFDTAGGRAKAEIGIDGFSLGLNTLTNMSNSWYFTGHIGVWRWSADLKVSVPGLATVRADDSGTDLYAGAGFGYNFSERFGAGLGATYYSVDVDGSNTGVYIVGLNTHYSF
jgi:OOP family OmpA-OmpF porin/outer membrane immunogenic protein